ncbi:hypothetical protein [Tardiphaga alba]|uniref:hypothetical protein n=1 Tax=Tardiphaga alba TaxID=340268 RepID=UPI001BA8BBD6|nr:hypothetical protein [Tardiphaga alba]
MLQWLRSFVTTQAGTAPGDDIPAFVDRSALADFVRLLHEADRDDYAANDPISADPN